MDLPAEHTAVLFHWPAPKDDKLFIYPSIILGEPLHQLIDMLIDEHCVAYGASANTDLVTEIILYWHFADGTWSYDDYVSHLAVS